MQTGPEKAVDDLRDATKAVNDLRDAIRDDLNQLKERLGKVEQDISQGIDRLEMMRVTQESFGGRLQDFEAGHRLTNDRLEMMQTTQAAIIAGAGTYRPTARERVPTGSSLTEPWSRWKIPSWHGR